MKTLKILAILCITLGFSNTNAICQRPTRDVMQISITIPFDCVGQELEGILTFERTYFNLHYQDRIYGTMTGKSDGLEYYFEGINNIADKANWDDWGLSAITYTWPGNYHIYRDGKLIGTMYFAFHMTVNANGEWAVYRGDVYEYSCVGGGKIK